MGRVEDARREADDAQKALLCVMGDICSRVDAKAVTSESALIAGIDVSRSDLHRLVEWIDRWYPREAKPTEPTPDAIREAFRRGAEAQREAIVASLTRFGYITSTLDARGVPLVTEPAP